MIVKWVLVLFVLGVAGLYGVTKLISFMNPPRPGRPGPPILARARRALAWSVVVPALVGLGILVLTLLRAL